MAINRKGISANVINSPSLLNNSPLGNENIFVGRVIDIILNSKHPEYDNYGGSTSIGGVFVELQNFNSPGSTFAKPFYPQFSSYPLVNELVLIQKLPGDNLNTGASNEIFYYINMINLWNHPHHNAFPNVGQLNTSITNQQTYNQTSQGITRQSNNPVPSSINLNSNVNPSQNTFLERNNIHPLLPFSGDIIHQGRWGNTIRLGSTVNQPDYPNNWSEVGAKGDPIMILTNGLLSTQNSSWVPTIENINNDDSSIYLTSTQNIPLFVSSYKTDSFGKNDISDPKDLPKAKKQKTDNEASHTSGPILEIEFVSGD